MSSAAPPLRIASRGSSLALAQARAVAALMMPYLGGREVSIEIIKTQGDARQDVLLTQLGEGVFVKALEAELLAGRADVAVHSLKDVPSAEFPELIIGAVPAREDPRDALVTRDGQPFDRLPQGALLATGSPRRIAQLRASRPDLRFTGVRGNVDTRLRKLDDGDFDGLVIAVAGLNRLELHARISTSFSVDQCVPAVGQGALAIQCRRDDGDTLALLRSIDDPNAHAETRAERAFLAAVGGGCRVPVGALARGVADGLRLWAVVADPDGQNLARSERMAAAVDAEQLGKLVAADLESAMQSLVRSSSPVTP
jgi:hydroxymethylbilane synthase